LTGCQYSSCPSKTWQSLACESAGVEEHTNLGTGRQFGELGSTQVVVQLIRVPSSLDCSAMPSFFLLTSKAKLVSCARAWKHISYIKGIVVKVQRRFALPPKAPVLAGACWQAGNQTNPSIYQSPLLVSKYHLITKVRNLKFHQGDGSADALSCFHNGAKTNAAQKYRSQSSRPPLKCALWCHAILVPSAIQELTSPTVNMTCFYPPLCQGRGSLCREISLEEASPSEKMIDCSAAPQEAMRGYLHFSFPPPPGHCHFCPSTPELVLLELAECSRSEIQECDSSVSLPDDTEKEVPIRWDACGSGTSSEKSCSQLPPSTWLKFGDILSQLLLFQEAFLDG
ncbi:hypothetical protein STEG23_029088, partial [Scotinomys teguina]